MERRIATMSSRCRSIDSRSWSACRSSTETDFSISASLARRAAMTGLISSPKALLSPATSIGAWWWRRQAFIHHATPSTPCIPHVALGSREWALGVWVYSGDDAPAPEAHQPVPAVDARRAGGPGEGPAAPQGREAAQGGGAGPDKAKAVRRGSKAAPR